jgi:hypothetical protein
MAIEDRLKLAVASKQYCHLCHAALRELQG